MTERKEDTRYAALVVYNNPDLRDPHAVAAKDAKRMLKTKAFVNIRQMIYLSLLDIYVAIVEIAKKDSDG